jgi:hypothetical protein
MKTWLLTLAVSIPIYFTLRSLLTAPDPHFFLGACYGFTSYLLADLAVSNWDRKK